MYVNRILERTIKRIDKTFKILYLSGPRQVGKTTMLLELSKKTKRHYVSLDDLQVRKLAQDDPELFLQTYPTPLLIDEVQYAPNLFPALKLHVDQQSKNGLYWLTGSQHFAVMKNVQESLAGRVGIVNLLGFSLAEKQGQQAAKHPFDLSKKINPDAPRLAIKQVFRHIFEGGFPALQKKPKPDRELFFNAYIQTYLDRDLRAIFNISKIPEFHRFLQLCAARTGQILNISDLARDADVSVNAAKEWLGILQSTWQIYLLQPYHANFSKRLIKAPKLYFLDTGLAAYLTKWDTPEVLMNGAMAGAYFETFVISEIIKSYLFRGKEAPLYFFRDTEGHEVDLLIQKNNQLFPIEIKLGAQINEKDAKNLTYFQKREKTADKGAIICLSQTTTALNRSVDILPVRMIE